MANKTPSDCFSDSRNLKNIADNIAEKAGKPSTAPNCYNNSINLKNIADNVADMSDGGSSGGIPSTRKILTDNGLSGGGDLSEDRTISLSNGTVSSLAKADTALQDGSQFATSAQGEKADTAVQPGDLGALASKDKIAVPGDINASGTPTSLTYLRGDGFWDELQSAVQSVNVITYVSPTLSKTYDGKNWGIYFDYQYNIQTKKASFTVKTKGNTVIFTAYTNIDGTNTIKNVIDLEYNFNITDSFWVKGISSNINNFSSFYFSWDFIHSPNSFILKLVPFKNTV